MKKLLMALALIVPTISFAQDKDVKVLKFDAYCMGSARMESVLNKFEERAFAKLKSERLVGSDTVKVESIMFANPKTRTWTIVEYVAEEMYCVVAVGSNLEPYTEK